jgi:hypothetical protein
MARSTVVAIRHARVFLQRPAGVQDHALSYRDLLAFFAGDCPVCLLLRVQ